MSKNDENRIGIGVSENFNIFFIKENDRDKTGNISVKKYHKKMTGV